MYLWTDGRKYEGWWYNGNKHGLGIYKDPSKSKVKYGLWEHGKRITWFNSQTIHLINDHQYKYEQEFKEAQSKNYLTSKATFNRPEDFDKDIEAIKKLFRLSECFPALQKSVFSQSKVNLIMKENEAKGKQLVNFKTANLDDKL